MNLEPDSKHIDNMVLAKDYIMGLHYVVKGPEFGVHRM